MTISINGINQSVPSKEDHGPGVQDITELKTVGPSERFDRQERYVEDETRPYYFDIQSVSAESLPDIVDPNDSPAAGRWIRLPAAGGGVPAAHAASHTDGSDQIAAVTGAVNGFMIAADKTKLDGIAALADVTGANAPQAHAASHTDGSDQIAAVTGADNGLMIAADKTKLDAIEALAEVNDVFSVHGRVGAVVAVANDYAHAELSAIGTDDHHAKLHAADHVSGVDTIQSATAAQVGLATAAQITKLDAIEALAEVNVVTAVFGRTGAIAATVGDYSHAQISAPGPDDHHAALHRASHISGGGDAFLATDLLESITKRIQTTTGPTIMVVGAVADGEFLKRVGATIVGAAAGGGAVTSVFGRVGVVVAVAGDYDSTEVTNVSGVFGGTVTSALDTLDTGKLNLAGDTMTGTLTLLSIIKATGGNDLEVQDDTGSTSFRVRATNGRVVFSKDIESNASDTLVIGKAGAQFKEIRVGIVTPGAGKTLTLTHGVAELAFGDDTQSNETLMLGLTPTTTGNMFLITDVARIGSFDFTYAVRSNPTLGIQSGAAAANEIGFIFHDGSDFIIDSAKSATDSLNLLTGGVIRLDISSTAILVHSPLHPATTGNIKLGDAGNVWDAIYVDAIRISTGFTHISFASGITTINPAGLDMDTRVRGDGDLDLLYVEAANDRVGIGTATPGTKLDVNGVLTVRGNILFDGDATRSIGSATAVVGTTWVRIVRPDAGQNLELWDKEGDEVVTLHGDETVFNDPGANRNWRVESEDDPLALTVDGELNTVGMGIAMNAHAAKLHVKQPISTDAKPVLALEQLDIDDSFINFIGTSAGDSSRSISSSVAEAAAKTGAVLVEANGATGWLRLYASAV